MFYEHGSVSSSLYMTKFYKLIIEGTRWLSRWDKELDLLVKLCYFSLTTGRGPILSALIFSCLIRAGSGANTWRRIHRYMAVLVPHSIRATFCRISYGFARVFAWAFGHARTIREKSFIESQVSCDFKMDKTHSNCV